MKWISAAMGMCPVIVRQRSWNPAVAEVFLTTMRGLNSELPGLYSAWAQDQQGGYWILWLNLCVSVP